MTPSQFQEAIRHLLCMTKMDFVRVFSPLIGDHLWIKRKDMEAAQFICYLDNHNMELLMKEFQNHLIKESAK